MAAKKKRSNKKQYKVTFREEVEYEVTFKSELNKDALTEGFDAVYGVETWFHEMMKDNPDWATNPDDLTVHERHLLELTEKKKRKPKRS